MRLLMQNHDVLAVSKFCYGCGKIHDRTTWLDKVHVDVLKLKFDLVSKGDKQIKIISLLTYKLGLDKVHVGLLLIMKTTFCLPVSYV